MDLNTKLAWADVVRFLLDNKTTLHVRSDGTVTLIGETRFTKDYAVTDVSNYDLEKAISVHSRKILD